MALLLRGAQLPAPVRQHRFHETRRWRFDFAWPDQKLALEIQGGGFVRGAHGRGAGLRNDAEKFSEAVCLGWRVLLAVSDHVDDGSAVRWVERALGRS